MTSKIPNFIFFLCSHRDCSAQNNEATGLRVNADDPGCDVVPSYDYQELVCRGRRGNNYRITFHSIREDGQIPAC